MKKCLMAGFSVALAINIWAQAPEMFRYQGRLVDGTTLVNATLLMSFKLYDAPAGGNLLYEDSSSVLVVDGLYAADIGDDTVFGSLTDALTNTAVYLELTIDGETLSPRERVVSVPYALNAEKDTTPSGTIILSSTYPNSNLENQGYSLYYEDVTQADWKTFEDLSFEGSQRIVFSFGNQFGIYSFPGYSEDENLHLTYDGIRWNDSFLPIEMSEPNSIIKELNGTLYCFNASAGSSSNACSSTDLQTWNTWTNYFGGTEMHPNQLGDLVVFKDALWAFVTDSTSAPYVMRSTNGINWSIMSGGSWRNIDAYNGHVTVDENKMWVSAQDPVNSSNRVWSSTDGISWRKSLGTTPSDMEVPKLVAFDNALWSFFPGSGGMESDGQCWKSFDDGDNWTLVSTDIPGYTYDSIYNIIEHEQKLWLSGSKDMHSAILWSTDGIEWNTSFYDGAGTLIGLPSGRLWFSDSFDGFGFYVGYIGGPKKQDGLYYYQKD